MAWKSKGKNKSSENTSDQNARYTPAPGDDKKADQWFQRAREWGDKRQYDAAIDYFVNGLEFNPDDVDNALKPLHGCGVARRMSGGGKPGLKDTMKRSTSDKDPKQAFLNSMWLFGHDPDNLGFIEGIVKNAGRLRAEDAALWAGGVCFKALENNPKAGSKQLQTLVNAMEQLGDRAAERAKALEEAGDMEGTRKENGFALEAFDRGINTLALWRRRAPKDQDVDKKLKDLSTKKTILRGKYQTSESYRDSISDIEYQKDLHDIERSVQSDQRVEQLIAKARQAHDEDPSSPEAIKSYVDLLCRRERDEEEKLAIGILVNAYKATGEYRWKRRADDIWIKQLGRKSRELAKAGERDALKMHRQGRLKFELNVFKERIEKYPTDLRLKFEYGVRLFQAGRYDEAIPILQNARADPKNRAACGLYLGRCFFRKEFHVQAIDILRETIDNYEFEDSDLAKEMQYWLGRSQEAVGQGDAARQTYGKLLQMDYNYKDILGRMEGLSKPG